MSGDGSNFIGFACGMKKSGKSHLLGQLAKPFPRRLIFDFLQEHAGKIPGALDAYDAVETVDALHACAGEKRWTIVSMCYPEDVPRLLSAIIPSGGRVTGFSRAVGGMLVECGEIDLIAPNNASIARPVKDMFQRGRHHLLSVLCATQRPRDTHRVVTSQSDLIAAFRQHEPRDIEYIDSVMGGRASRELATLARYEHLRYFPNMGQLQRVDAAGRVALVAA